VALSSTIKPQDMQMIVINGVTALLQCWLHMTQHTQCVSV
jgi:hypothetical protein